MNVDINLDQILCPVVPSNLSDESLRCAIALARAHGAKLYVLNCIDELAPARSLESLETREALKKSIERSVDLHNVNGDVRPLNWEPIIAAGQPADAITREAAERKVDLIVMSSRHRPFAAALLGSTAEMVSRTAPCPLLVVRLGGDRPANGTTHGIAFRRLLVATDFSSDSELALRHGFSLAQKYQSHLHLLHVLSDSPTKGEDIDWNTPGADSPYYEAARRLHESIPAQVHLWSEVTHAVREGKPYREILSYAAEHQIDLICIGAHGKGFQSSGLFGSNADRVLRESPSPVLVLRLPKSIATD